MVHEMINGTFRQTNLPNESHEYLTKREELRLAEIALMRQSEQVADLRRSLPQGAVIQEYEFEEGPADLDAGDTPIQKVRLNKLFTTPGRSVMVYHFMFGKKQTNPCPMCTPVIDGWTWCRSSSGSEHRRRHRCRGRPDSPARTRSQARLG
jgi:predicted dithiol-disulfide oxidoreductase (DUF899 family)